MLPTMAVLVSGYNLSSQELSGEKSDSANLLMNISLTRVYQCHDYEFSTYGDSGEIPLDLPDRTVALSRIPSALA